MKVRKAVVSGQFYSSDGYDIERMIDRYNHALDTHVADLDRLFALDTRGVMVPHAGYIYSGFTANVAFRILGAKKPERVVVIGPSHRVYIEGFSVGVYDAYETPLGSLRGDMALAKRLIEAFGAKHFSQAHAEHSTEVQFPFLKYYLPEVSVVELVYGKEDPAHLSGVIDVLLSDSACAVVISTDLSHYYMLEKAKKHDTVCLDAVASLDPVKLHQGCEACGIIGMEAMILSARESGLTPHILDYRTSADTNGDEKQVVGYASAIFTKESKA